MLPITVAEKRFNVDNVTDVDNNTGTGDITIVTVWLVNNRTIHLYDQEAEYFLEWWDSMVKSHPASWKLYKGTVKKGDQ